MQNATHLSGLVGTRRSSAPVIGASLSRREEAVPLVADEQARWHAFVQLYGQRSVPHLAMSKLGMYVHTAPKASSPELQDIFPADIDALIALMAFSRSSEPETLLPFAIHRVEFISLGCRQQLKLSAVRIRLAQCRPLPTTEQRFLPMHRLRAPRAAAMPRELCGTRKRIRLPWSWLVSDIVGSQSRTLGASISTARLSPRWISRRPAPRWADSSSEVLCIQRTPALAGEGTCHR